MGPGSLASMTEATEFIIGSEVSCSDGPCGTLRRVVVDPVARALTHLAVEPGQGQGAGRLVPVDLVSSAAQEIQLRCTRAEFDALEEADESQFLPSAGKHPSYRPDQIYALPYYRLGLGMRGLAKDRGQADPQERSYDRVPVGEVEVRRGDHVDATDGAVGHVQGLVIDPSDHHVTHILLDEGHLWGEKTVAIPIGAVNRIGEIIRLSLTKDEVGDLPAIDVQHPADTPG
jgi:sporulation protein YlmC with PRC-barrel domain